MAGLRTPRTALASRYLAGLASCAVLLSSWWVLLPHDTVTTVLFIGMVLAGSCGILGTFVFPNGGPAAYRALWVALGLLLAVALLTLMSVGAFYLAAAALVGRALASLPNASAWTWWHPRYFAGGLLAFTLAF
jgi:hypothetical protein